MSSRDTGTLTEIYRALLLSERLHMLVSNDRQFRTRNRFRDVLAFQYWNVVFDHHQGILQLFRLSLDAPAMAVRRIFREAVLRAVIVMQGSDQEVENIRAGRFSLNEKRAGELVQAALGSRDFGVYLHETASDLHDLTHSGKSLLARYITFRVDDCEIDIECTVSNEEVLHVIEETLMHVSILVFIGLRFFEMDPELLLADGLLTEFQQSTALRSQPPIFRPKG